MVRTIGALRTKELQLAKSNSGEREHNGIQNPRWKAQFGIRSAHWWGVQARVSDQGLLSQTKAGTAVLELYELLDRDLGSEKWWQGDSCHTSRMLSQSLLNISYC